LRELGVSLRELEPVLSEEELVWAKDFKARKPELSPAEAADLLFALGGPEVYHLLVEVRGWSLKQFEAHYADLLGRLLRPER